MASFKTTSRKTYGDVSPRKSTATGMKEHHFGRIHGFHLFVNGQIASAQLDGITNPACKYQFVTGSDWDCVKGFADGETQVSKNKKPKGTAEPSAVWNFPLSVVFKATNVSGWPRLVIAVRDAGRVIYGYGTVSVPTIPGSYVRYVQLFTPVSASWIQSIISYLTGEPPDFYDARFTTANDGRYAARVKSCGVVKVKFDVYVTGAAALGYDFGEPDEEALEGDDIIRQHRR